MKKPSLKQFLKDKQSSSHSDNDIASNLKKIMETSSFHELKRKAMFTSSPKEIARGLLKFKHDNKHIVISYDGECKYDGANLTVEVPGNGDIYSQYSNNFHVVLNHIKDLKSED